MITIDTFLASLNPEQASAMNALLIEQRDALVAVHVEQLAKALANDQAQLAAIAARDAEIARLTALVPAPVEA